MAVEYCCTGANQFLHKERSFPRLPDRNETQSLLAELATAPCRFSPVLADVPLALYGAGNLGRLARDYLNAVGHEFTLVVDRNARAMAKDSDWSGVPLLHPDDVPDSAKGRVRLAVSVVTSPYVSLERSLSGLGFKDIVPFYDLAESFRHLHPLSNGWFAAPLSAEDQHNTASVLAFWEDDISRAHHLQFLAWRRLREEWTFAAAAPVPNGSRFFIPEVLSVLHGNEILLDAGAHHGSVTEAFLKQTKGAFREIIAIEPDPSNRAVLLDRLQSWLPDKQRVMVLDCALAKDEGEASFHDGLDYASQLSETGEMQVVVRPLDALGLAPTFIKLHVEGAELAALKGARETLLSRRPMIAATVYHNDDGIWKTALWLMQMLPGYRFLFRLHSWCGTGAVIYAIPEERAKSPKLPAIEGRSQYSSRGEKVGRH
jgi:FkbM family methyltransferase